MEIERRWLVKNVKKNPFGMNDYQLDAYIYDSRRSVSTRFRARPSQNKYFVTTKFGTDKEGQLCRHEIENQISQAEFEDATSKLYIMRVPFVQWHGCDIKQLGDNVLIEVEFNSTHEAALFNWGKYLGDNIKEFNEYFGSTESFFEVTNDPALNALSAYQEIVEDILHGGQ